MQDPPFKCKFKQVPKALCKQYILGFFKLLCNVDVRKLRMIPEFEFRIR